MRDRRVDLDRVDQLEVRRRQGRDRAADAETMPTASESSFPSGLPIAATGSPTTTSAERPSGSGASACAGGSTRMTPTSSKTSQPTIWPARGRDRRTRRRPGRGAAPCRGRLARVRDHVRVREDRPVGRDDEARALGALAAEVREDRHDPGERSAKIRAGEKPGGRCGRRRRGGGAAGACSTTRTRRAVAGREARRRGRCRAPQPAERRRRRARGAAQAHCAATVLATSGAFSRGNGRRTAP